MINKHGLDEAGIDGGGLLREFLIQLLETGFDPTRGFFVLTSDGQLYPNPNIKIIVENYEQHYYFLGRMLAKAIQCKILSQLKFAGFFLQKILSKYVDTRLDIDYLASLDPEIYRNLIYLKDYKSNVKDLDLNFAINSNQFGQTETVELKPGGKDILVTNDNKIEYIHLLADYKLNKQINEQVKAFRNGISNIINLDLLRLFNFNELQSLISGPNDSIDVDDWKRNTIYAGLYNPDHVVIVNFWNIVESFTEDQKRKLLKFATSRSKPPLFGFQNLIPNFAIHSSGDQERLPSASTCLNLLKLPPIEDIQTLKEKLICAIESDSGFELS
jgi:ubiquitin-protein ligase E3 C